MNTPIYVCLCHDYTINRTEIIGLFTDKNKAKDCILEASQWLKDDNPENYHIDGDSISGVSVSNLGDLSISYSYKYYIVEKELE